MNDATITATEAQMAWDAGLDAGCGEERGESLQAALAALAGEGWQVVHVAPTWEDIAVLTRNGGEWMALAADEDGSRALAVRF